ncbi:MAG: type II toxin-antitoxin system RelE/ParE family toxin [Caulobacteraceae bacterium]
MHTVAETHAFIRAAERVGMSEAERTDAVATVAATPAAGDLIVGSGGCRKVRIAGRGKGKSGGYRVITYFQGGDGVVFLLWVLSKGRDANLTEAQVNELAKIVRTLA